jgi:hypothetical protein
VEAVKVPGRSVLVCGDTLREEISKAQPPGYKGVTWQQAGIRDDSAPTSC